MNFRDNFTVQNIKINNLKPIRKNFKNKNNKFSAKGLFGNKQVKIYEVFDRNQGELREFVSNNKKLSKYFPKLITYNKKYIVEEWVIGKTLRNTNKKNFVNNSQYKEIKKFINLMWSVRYNRVVFDYINYIHKRVKKINNIDLKDVPIRINHNDLSIDNILITSNGIKIIDNEFLGCSTGWLLNIKNSFILENYKYQNFISEEDLNKLWNVRREWSNVRYKKKKLF